jgi:hypothetical protein
MGILLSNLLLAQISPLSLGGVRGGILLWQLMLLHFGKPLFILNIIPHLASPNLGKEISIPLNSKGVSLLFFSNFPS